MLEKGLRICRKSGRDPCISKENIAMRIVGIFSPVCFFFMVIAQAGLKLMIDPLASVYLMTHMH